MALWSGRFEEGVDESAQDFGASLGIDRRMYRQDIAGSIAHAKMLAQQKIIRDEDGRAICQGLKDIEDKIDSGQFVWDEADEDIHMAIESELTREIGEAGGRLHTGRSRNDQVACDLRLYAKELLSRLMEGNCRLRETLFEAARKDLGAVLPGYTHLQHAQPVLFSHHLLAYFWMLARDHSRLARAFEAADANPLGAAALAGTSYPLDRGLTSELLGFSSTMPNSLDAVSDRDYLLDLEYACSVSMMHLSRLCEEIILWSSGEFGFVTLSDGFSTGSSIMPQKKNPDFAELTRGKTGRVVGSLVGLLVTMKGLPLAYNKDLQECKEGAFDAADTLLGCMSCVEGMVRTWKTHPQRMLEQARKGFGAATDVADYLVKKGLPFRRAHEVVGELVLYCERKGVELGELSLEEFRGFSPLFEQDVTKGLDPVGVANARTTYGGTALSSVKLQLQEARQVLARDAVPPGRP